MTFDSPLQGPFIGDDARTLASPLVAGEASLSFELAGPRAKLALDPQKSRVAIVTCGGLCPGINNVVRALFLQLFHGYGVGTVFGVRYGLEGLAAGGLEPLRLSPEMVRHIHRLGGSVLGTSRGRQDNREMVAALSRSSIDVLFVIGGNGTLRAASSLGKEIEAQGLSTNIVAIPKTIDDDVAFIDESFGFETAIEHARAAIDAAHIEATGAHHGIGVVKLMGRDAGFIAAHAALASAEANFCLLPEYPFDVDRLLGAIHARVERRGHAVVVVAEGCGAVLAGENAERDPSGNFRYASASLDVGPWLCDALAHHFSKAHVPITLKYIDPSYTIRAAPANAADAVYCTLLARHAAHAAMAGRRNVLVGRCHGIFAHVPIELAATQTATASEELWHAVREVTGQGDLR